VKHWPGIAATLYTIPETTYTAMHPAWVKPMLRSYSSSGTATSRMGWGTGKKWGQAVG